MPKITSVMGSSDPSNVVQIKDATSATTELSKNTTDMAFFRRLVCRCQIDRGRVSFDRSLAPRNPAPVHLFFLTVCSDLKCTNSQGTRQKGKKKNLFTILVGFLTPMLYCFLSNGQVLIILDVHQIGNPPRLAFCKHGFPEFSALKPPQSLPT